VPFGNEDHGKAKIHPRRLGVTRRPLRVRRWQLRRRKKIVPQFGLKLNNIEYFGYWQKRAADRPNPAPCISRRQTYCIHGLPMSRSPVVGNFSKIKIQRRPLN
ncbi:MAG: hypothetical protein PVI34_05840, partial [Desulfobacterales bacterium]